MERQQKSPYSRGNTAEILNFLEQLNLVIGKEEGFRAINEELGGYQDLIINSEAVALEVPDIAVSAVIIIEADLDSTMGHRVVRFKENGSDPMANSGFALGDNDMYSIIGKRNLERFRILSTEENRTHIARVQFFESNQFKN